MSKKLVAFVVLILLGLSMADLCAATPADENSIRELMSLTNAANRGVQFMQNMLPALKRLVPQVPESFWVEFMNEVDPNELINLIVPIYKKHFTEEEIQEMIKFYKTPVGMKLIQEQSQITKESMAAGQQLGEQLARRVIQKANKLKPKSP